MNLKDNYIPIFLDKDVSNVENTSGNLRFNYFYIELETPSPVTISNNQNNLPMLLIDLEGILLYKLGSKQELFNSPQDITELFDHINNKTNYVLSVNYLWLPNTILSHLPKRKIHRWEIIRIHESIFIQAIIKIHSLEDIGFDETYKKEMIYLSEKESIAFTQWGQQTLDKIKERYRTNTRMNLRERDANK